MIKVMDSAFKVENILDLEFINASGKVVKLSSENLLDREEDITFFHFNFMIDLTQEDACINQEPFCFNFDLSIMHQNFDNATNNVEDIISLAKTKIRKLVRKSGRVSEILGGVSQLFSTPVG